VKADQTGADREAKPSRMAGQAAEFTRSQVLESRVVEGRGLYPITSTQYPPLGDFSLG
jgi:hypothetical protein